MADEKEFDTRGAMSRKKDILDQAISIRNTLTDAINAYYDRTPRTESEATETMGKIRDAIIDAERAYSRLADAVR